MEELKAINELEENAMKDLEFWTKEYENILKRIENLKEIRKEILTQLDYLGK